MDWDGIFLACGATSVCRYRQCCSNYKVTSRAESLRQPLEVLFCCCWLSCAMQAPAKPAAAATQGTAAAGATQGTAAAGNGDGDSEGAAVAAAAATTPSGTAAQ